MIWRHDVIRSEFVPSTLSDLDLLHPGRAVQTDHSPSGGSSPAVPSSERKTAHKCGGGKVQRKGFLFFLNNKKIFWNFVGQKSASLDYLFLDGSRATFEMLKKLYKEISQNRSLAKLNYNFMAKFTREKLFSWSWAWLVLVIIKGKQKSSYISFRINYLSSP